jgi:hypothetical protein
MIKRQTASPAERPTILMAEKVLFFSKFRQAVLK